MRLFLLMLLGGCGADTFVSASDGGLASDGGSPSDAADAADRSAPSGFCASRSGALFCADWDKPNMQSFDEGWSGKQLMGATPKMNEQVFRSPPRSFQTSASSSATAAGFAIKDMINTGQSDIHLGFAFRWVPGGGGVTPSMYFARLIVNFQLGKGEAAVELRNGVDVVVHITNGVAGGCKIGTLPPNDNAWHAIDLGLSRSGLPRFFARHDGVAVPMCNVTAAGNPVVTSVATHAGILDSAAPNGSIFIDDLYVDTQVPN